MYLKAALTLTHVCTIWCNWSWHDMLRRPRYSGWAT